MQISRNYISMKFYYQIHKKEINIVTLDEFQILMCILQESVM